MPNPADLHQWNQDDHLVTERGTRIVPWEHVAGFPTTDLESILTPARAYHKRPFQLSLDSYYCVSYPLYVPENGIWKKKAKKRKKPQSGAKEEDDEVNMPVTDTDAAGPNGGMKASEQEELYDYVQSCVHPEP